MRVVMCEYREPNSPFKSSFDPFTISKTRDGVEKKRKNLISIFHLLIFDSFTIPTHICLWFFWEGKPIMQSEWLAVWELMAHIKPFEIVTDKGSIMDNKREIGEFQKARKVVFENVELGNFWVFHWFLIGNF